MTQKLHSLIKGAGLFIPQDLENVQVESLTCDSRVVSHGSLFLGLPGENIDGGTFWRKALDDGAVAAVIGPYAAAKVPPDCLDQVLVVPDPVNKWVGRIASAFWGNPSSKLKLIGVTGTNGKTTIAFLIEYLSKRLGNKTALFGTLYKRWPGYSTEASHTTDFADVLQAQLASAVEAGVELAAMEVSSHSLSQQRVAGCSFSGAIFTNLTQDHLDYHCSMKDYFEAKSLLFKFPFLDSKDSKAIVNIDDPWGNKLAKRLGKSCWRSSILEALNGKSAELKIVDLKMTNELSKGRLITPLGEADFVSPLIGDFNLMNLLQAIGVLIQQGFPLSKLAEAIEDFPGVPGRMERVLISEEEDDDKHLHMPIVIVDYAHTPDGLDNALRALRPFTAGELICVFGCGGDRDKEKRSKMGNIAARLADHVVVTSDNPRTENPNIIIQEILTGIPARISIEVEVDRAKAIASAIQKASNQDIVLVAGKGHESYQILGNTKIHFDDREEVSKALKDKVKNSLS